MFKAVAREYIPDGAEYTEQMIDDVRDPFWPPSFLFFVTLTLCAQRSVLPGCLHWEELACRTILPALCASSPRTPRGGSRGKPSASTVAHTGDLAWLPTRTR